MTIQEYLAKLDAKLQELSDIILTSSIQREVDANLGIGFIKGRFVFLDGSTLDFFAYPTGRGRASGDNPAGSIGQD
jgi:hypothetical protein